MEIDQAHFESIPWCKELIEDPDFAITPTFSRILKDGHEDSLVAITLNSPTTISHILSLYRRPPASSSSSFITEVRCLMTIGSDLNGGPDMLHGGIISALMDDVVGILLTINKDGSEGGLPYSSNTVTRWMKTSYDNPVVTPQTLCILAVLRKREGRKFWMDSEVRDQNGLKLASSESLWIQIRRHTDEKL